MLEDGLIKGFVPKFKSIRKDCDRYFDAVLELWEAGEIERTDVLDLSAAGSLWITFQYIDNGHIDLVEKDTLSDVKSRDFYGTLFENTAKILDRFLDISEGERVIRIYRAAITHRVKALMSEAKVMETSKRTDSRNASAKWVKHYLPAIRTITSNYRALLKKLHQEDAELDVHLEKIATIETAVKRYLLQDG